MSVSVASVGEHAIRWQLWRMTVEKAEPLPRSSDWARRRRVERGQLCRDINSRSARTHDCGWWLMAVGTVGGVDGGCRWWPMMVAGEDWWRMWEMVDGCGWWLTMLVDDEWRWLSALNSDGCGWWVMADGGCWWWLMVSMWLQPETDEDDPYNVYRGGNFIHGCHSVYCHFFLVLCWMVANVYSLLLWRNLSYYNAMKRLCKNIINKKTSIHLLLICLFIFLLISLSYVMDGECKIFKKWEKIRKYYWRNITIFKYKFKLIPKSKRPAEISSWGRNTVRNKTKKAMDLCTFGHHFHWLDWLFGNSLFLFILSLH